VPGRGYNTVSIFAKPRTVIYLRRIEDNRALFFKLISQLCLAYICLLCAVRVMRLSTTSRLNRPISPGLGESGCGAGDNVLHCHHQSSFGVDPPSTS